MADIELGAEDRGLAEELERFKRRLEAEGHEVDLWSHVRKSAGVGDAGVWLLEIVVGAAITDAVYPSIKQFLQAWFTETPQADRRPLRVRVRRADEADPFEEFDLDDR